jgi:hypothetical protein
VNEPPEVWLYEDKSGGFYINNEQDSKLYFKSEKEREKWLSNFPDVVRHQGKPPARENEHADTGKC